MPCCVPGPIGPGEIGDLALHPLDVVAIRFRRGTFLIAADRLEPAVQADSP